MKHNLMLYFSSLNKELKKNQNLNYKYIMGIKKNVFR